MKTSDSSVLFPRGCGQEEVIRAAQLRIPPTEHPATESGTVAKDALGAGGVLPPVLDVCCGSRMFWFDRKDGRALFVDKRRETHLAKDCSVKNGEREIVVNPDILADFTALPFADESFALVVFDPPHIQRNGDTSWLLKKYGVLRGQWREMLTRGFAECFRVLRPEGTLIFKWCEIEIPLREILELTPEKPLFGHRTGRQAKTHWVAFLKECAPSAAQACDSTTRPSGGVRQAQLEWEGRGND